MKWIKFKTGNGNFITVKEDDIARILIDPSTGNGTLTLNNSCFTYDVVDTGISDFLCGLSAADSIPDHDPEILRSEIQDLKLENDRLKKRDEIMLKFIKSAYCNGMSCFNCLFFDDTQPSGRKCLYNRSTILFIAGKVLEELDNL